MPKQIDFVRKGAGKIKQTVEGKGECDEKGSFENNCNVFQGGLWGEPSEICEKNSCQEKPSFETPRASR